MTVEKLIEEILSHTYGSEPNKNLFRDYLMGEIKEPPENNIMDTVHVYFYGSELHEECVECIQKNEFGEKWEIIKRYIHLMSIKKVESMTYTFFSFPDRYQIYKLVGVSDAFIEQEFVGYISTLFQQYNNMSIKEKLLNSLDEFEQSYESIAKKFRKDCEKNNEMKQIASIFLIANSEKNQLEKKTLASKLFSNNNHQMKETERILYTLLNELFHTKLERVSEEYSNEENAKQYLKNMNPFPFHIKSEMSMNLLFTIFESFSKYSKLVREAARLAIILAPPEFLNRRYNDETKVMDLLHSNHFPDEFKLRFCCYRMANFYGCDRMKYSEIMEDILNKNGASSFKKNMDVMKEYKEIRYMVLLAVLLKNNGIGDEEKQKEIAFAEEYIMDEFRNLQSAYNWFTLNEQCHADFEFLKNGNVSSDVRSSDSSNFNFGQRDLAIGCAVLCDYSLVAANGIEMILHGTSRYNRYSVDIFVNFYLFGSKSEKKLCDRLYENVGISLENICLVYISRNYYYYHSEPSIEKILPEKEFYEFLQKHRQETEMGISAFLYDNSDMLDFCKLVYDKDNGFDYCYLTSVFNRKMKTVADYAEKLLKKRTETRPYVEKLLESKSKATTDAALRLIRLWDNDKIEKELNEIKSIEGLANYIEKLYTKKNEANVPYANVIDYSFVRAENGETYPEILTKYYVSEYIMLKELYEVKSCKSILKSANIYDFRALIKNIYEMWISEGAGAKYKNILFPYALTAGESQLIELKKQIDSWAENSKPALSAFAVQCLCMNQSKMALMLVETMSKKHKSKKVKSAALAALDSVAVEMGLSKEELDDLMVPNLEFDKDRSRIFDYGKRYFKAVLNEKLEITLFDEGGKAIKSLPKASEKSGDSLDMVADAKESLKVIKKQLGVVVNSQKPRIESAVLTGRKWTAPKWKALFVDNPIMNIFASGLIWEELDSEGNLLQTFRYMEDGTLNTAQEEEHELKESSYVSPLHTVDISEEELHTWVEQLEDYEVVQPVSQLNIPVCRLSENELKQYEITDYRGKKVYGATLKSIAQKLGLTPDYSDYGQCSGCYYIEKDSGLIMKFKAESFYSGDYNSLTELDTIYFSQTETGQKITLSEVPKRLLSLALLAGNMITAKAVEAKEE